MILMSCILLFCFLDQPFGAEVFPFFHGTVIDFAMRLCSLQLTEKSLHEAFLFSNKWSNVSGVTIKFCLRDRLDSNRRQTNSFVSFLGCVDAVNHAWNFVSTRINLMSILIDQTNPQEVTAATLRRTPKRPSPIHEYYLGLWRNYLTVACGAWTSSSCVSRNSTLEATLSTSVTPAAAAASSSGPPQVCLSVCLDQFFPVAKCTLSPFNNLKQDGNV